MNYPMIVFDTLIIDQINRVLLQSRENQDIYRTEIEDIVQTRINYFMKILERLEREYKDWIDALEEWRNESSLLSLFSNRQIMNMIILLTKSTPSYQVKHQLFKKLYLSDEANGCRDNDDDITTYITAYSLADYLRSLPINDYDRLENMEPDLYKKYELEHNLKVDASLMHLNGFLAEFSDCLQPTIPKHSMNDETRQYLIALNSNHQKSDKKSLEYTFSADTFYTLLNLFEHRLPSAAQILWCSEANEEDIHLFFRRIRTFSTMVFIIMDIDKMHSRLREVLLNEQDLLTKYREPHGIVYYFSRELTMYRRGLKSYRVNPTDRDARPTYSKLNQLFEQTKRMPPEIRIICGDEGTGKLTETVHNLIPTTMILFLFVLGKTHRIKTKYIEENTLRFSINDKLDLPSFISALLLHDAHTLDTHATVYISISVHSPFDDLNRALFSLFVCGSLTDPISGLTFALPTKKTWKFFIEIPYSSKYEMTITENLDYLLPVLSVIAPSSIEIVTNEEYQLHIGEERGISGSIS